MACDSDRVPLTYRLEPGRRVEHRLRLEAEITRTLQGQTREQRVVATFRAAQQVTAPLSAGGAEATFSLAPESLRVDGRPVDPGPDQEFVVELAADGRVVGISEVAGQTGQALGPGGIERLLPRLRPVLPGEPVRPGDGWRSDTQFVDETGRFSLQASSRLKHLGEVRGHDAALVRTTSESPVDRQEVFANAVADLEGTDVGAQQAWFALDGFLIEATGDSVGSYDVTFSPAEQEVEVVPVQASLVVRLHSELRLLSADPAAG